MLLLEREDGGGKEEEKGSYKTIYPSSAVHISEIQILFVRGKTCEGFQCANQDHWRTQRGGSTGDGCQQLAVKMPGKLRQTRGSKRHGSARQEWAGDSHRPGLPTLLRPMDLVQCKKEMGNHKFELSSKGEGMTV